MSGKRHHFLPQFLLKGFASRKKGKQTYCWVYPATSNPREDNVKNVGFEGYFYGNPEESEADAAITKAEDRYANFANELRETPATGRISSQQAAELAVHISIRTRHIRSTFSSAAANFLRKISEELLATPEDFERVVLRQIRTAPDYLRDAMRGEMHKRGLTELLDENAVEQ